MCRNDGVTVLHNNQIYYGGTHQNYGDNDWKQGKSPLEQHIIETFFPPNGPMVTIFISTVQSLEKFSLVFVQKRCGAEQSDYSWNNLSLPGT